MTLLWHCEVRSGHGTGTVDVRHVKQAVFIVRSVALKGVTTANSLWQSS
jgi:hypothetical protein